MRLAGDVLEPAVHVKSRSSKLLLSSEWEYSPFTFTNFPGLPEFLFIGLPAPESGNPLTVPVAGHELGHTVWLARDLGNLLEPRIKNAVVDAIKARWVKFQKLFQLTVQTSELTTNLTIVGLWSLSIDLCLKQAEETFCDFLGIRLFRQSYLHAFAYVLAPSITQRSVFYPAIQTRVANFVKATIRYGVTIDPKYGDLFHADGLGPLSDAEEFRVEIADAALAAIVSDLIELADKIVLEAKLKEPTDQETARIRARYKQVVPAEGCQTIADILNAAWEAFLDGDLWKEFETIAARRDEILKELVLKNFEVFEIERIQAAT